MSGDIEALKRTIRALVSKDFDRVPPKTETAQGVHLEVWKARSKPRVLGLEMDHAEIVNFWVRTGSVGASLPPSVEAIHKVPKGRVWTDGNGRGANSNLSGYDEFRGSKITRLGITNEADARLIIERLTT